MTNGADLPHLSLKYLVVQVFHILVDLFSEESSIRLFCRSKTTVSQKFRQHMQGDPIIDVHDSKTMSCYVHCYVHGHFCVSADSGKYPIDTLILCVSAHEQKFLIADIETFWKPIEYKTVIKIVSFPAV